MVWRWTGIAVALGTASMASAQCVECAQQTNGAFLSSQTVRNSQDAAHRAGRYRRAPASELGVSREMRDRYPGLSLHKERRGAQFVTVACGVDRGGTKRCRDIG